MTVFQHTVPACPSCRQPAGGVHERDCGAMKVREEPMEDLRQRIETALRSQVRVGLKTDMGSAVVFNGGIPGATDAVMSALQPDIDAIAEAICNAYTSDSESVARWKFQGPFGRNRHRRAARAAAEVWMGQHD